MAPHARKPLAFVNARLVDPEKGVETRGGVLVENGVIKAFGGDVTRTNLPGEAAVVDCRGDVLAPGLIDFRAGVGGQGEALATVQAAARGGVKTLVASPESFSLPGANASGVRILPVGAISQDFEGKKLAEFGLSRQAGAIAFSDGSRSIRNSQLLRRAMLYARDLGALIVHFPQDEDLAGDGVMNDGLLASRLGLIGVPREAEAIALDRDLSLVRMTAASYCAAPISTTLALEAIARAKKQGLPVSCGVTINHLTFNEIDISAYNSLFKFQPPLRREEERLALVEAVASGLIDIVFSDHTPQPDAEKQKTFAEAAFGAVGLETLLPAALRLVHAEQIGLPQMLRAMTSRPAEILGLPQGRLALGAPADLICIDPDDPFVLSRDELKSDCKNTPFDRARLQGRVKTTMVGGEIIYSSLSEDAHA